MYIIQNNYIIFVLECFFQYVFTLHSPPSPILWLLFTGIKSCFQVKPNLNFSLIEKISSWNLAINAVTGEKTVECPQTLISQLCLQIQLIIWWHSVWSHRIIIIIKYTTTCFVLSFTSVRGRKVQAKKVTVMMKIVNHWWVSLYEHASHTGGCSEWGNSQSLTSGCPVVDLHLTKVGWVILLVTWCWKYWVVIDVETRLD